MNRGDVVKNGRCFGHIERVYSEPVDVWHFCAVVYGWPVQPAAGVHASRIAALYAIEDLLLGANAIRDDETLVLAPEAGKSDPAEVLS